MRLTGLDLKMEQYRLASYSSTPSSRSRDRAFMNRVWTGPETLPTLDEIADAGSLDRPHGAHPLRGQLH